MRRLAGRLAGRVAAGLLALAAAAPALAAWLRYCDAPQPLSAAQQSRLLRVAALLRERLAASGSAAALVSRSGLSLERFGQRYSHAGVALAGHPGAAWTVRQLYFACDEGAPRLYDQGLAGFVSGTADPELGYLSVLLLPADAAQPLADAALDARRALALLGERYSANAYPYSLRYQNCNQWLAELLASAWGRLDGAAESPRAAAQRWLRDAGFDGTPVHVGAWMLASLFVRWVQRDDHPPEDLAAALFRVTLPASIEAFVQRLQPGVRRLELCHDTQRIVLRDSGKAFGEGCSAEPGDHVVALADPAP